MYIRILAAWTALYWRSLLLEIIKDIKNKDKRREENGKMPAGLKDLEQGFDPHMLDVARFFDFSLSQINEVTIVG